MLDQELKQNTLEFNYNITESAYNILQYRLQTTPEYECFDEYKNNLKHSISEIERNPQYHISGITYEALFYESCKDILSVDLRISDGIEDARGIDFFLTTSSKSFAVDVTSDIRKYPQKVKDTDKCTLMLPSKMEYHLKISRGEYIDPYEYINDVYKLNMMILANRNPDFQIILKSGNHKDGHRPPKFLKCPSLGKYTYMKKPKRKNNCSQEVIMAKSIYEKTLAILSILNNTNP